MSDMARKAALLLVFLAAAPCAAGGKGAGTSGAAFLKVASGARPAALGEAFTAVSDDVNAVAWNPAGLSAVTSPQFTAVHGQWIQDYNQDFVAAAYPFAWGVVGLGFTSLSVDGIEARASDSAAPDSTFGADDTAYNLSYGRALGDAWSLGLGLTYIRQSLAGRSASAMAGHAGVKWKAVSRPLALGASVRNAGSEVKFDQEGDPLPMIVAVGAAYRVLGERLRFSADARSPRDGDTSFGAGAEWVQPLRGDLSGAFRAGYNTASTDPTDGLVGVAAGMGITWRNWGFDMAWAPYGSLGHTFRYALLVKF